MTLRKDNPDKYRASQFIQRLCPLTASLGLCLCLLAPSPAQAGGPSIFDIDGEWTLFGGTLGIATNGVPIGFELTQVHHEDDGWSGMIFDYRYTLYEDERPHSLAIGVETGVFTGGADLSLVALMGQADTEFGGRLRGCAALILFSACAGVTASSSHLILGLDLAAKIPTRNR